MVTISESTIRQNVFTTLFNLIDGEISGYDVVSAFPEKTPSFPCVVINAASITLDLVTLNSAGANDYSGSIDIEFYDYVKNGKSSVDAAKDALVALFTDTTNDAALKADGFLFNGVSADESDNIVFGGEKFNTGLLTIEFV